MPDSRLASQALINRVVVGSIVAGFVILAGVVVFAGLLLQRNVTFTDWTTHTYQVQRAIADFRAINEQVETARRGYLLDGDQRFLDLYRSTAARQGPALDRLETLVSDNGEQIQNVQRLRLLVAGQSQAIEDSFRAMARGRREYLEFDLDPSTLQTREIRILLARMQDEEGDKLDMRNTERRETLDSLVRALVFGSVLLIILAIGSVVILIRYTADLNRSRSALRRVNDNLELEVQRRTADLQRANDEIQRFAYIVSHDLRSPLVNIMGFTSELDAAAKPLERLLAATEDKAPKPVVQAAAEAVREDLPEAIRFIRNSAQKMDRLINAILDLSRAGRRVLSPEPLDMNAVIEAAIGNLKHRSDEVGATIQISGDLPSIVSDRLAIEQIFSNLLENGLKYRSPKRPGEITVSGHREPGGRVVYDVKDNGRGVDPKDHERIFELFRRSGAQDQPGEGIGLAHVRALGYRLGGTISVDSELDRGATFRVSLPAQLSAEGR